jgi:hypothetical protein
LGGRAYIASARHEIHDGRLGSLASLRMKRTARALGARASEDSIAAAKRFDRRRAAR